MKKIVLAIFAFALVGCSAISNIPFLQARTPAPAVANSPQPTVTLVVPPSTNTPDLFAVNTPVPSNTLASGTSGTPLVVTNTPFPTFPPTRRPTITLEPVDITLFTPGPNPFSLFQKSTTQLVWGTSCDGARSIKFVVQVTSVVRHLKYVLLFIRLQDKYSARHTEWGAGAIMSNNKRGTYFYTINLDQIDDYKNFEDAWLQYQFVAANVYLNRLGASVVDRNGISLTHCKVFNP